MTERILRQDVWIDDAKINELLVKGVAAGFTVADLFCGINLFLENNGTVVAEFYPDETLIYVTFGPDEWGPSDQATDEMRRKFDKIRPKTAESEVYDIFTGEQIGETQLNIRRKRDDQRRQNRGDRRRSVSF